jgi:hypothetical protein
MKTGPDVVGTTEKGFGSAKHVNWTRRPRARRKCVRERKIGKRDPTLFVPPKTGLGAQNMKTGHIALGTAENESGSAIHENGTRCRWYCRKWVQERKTCKLDPTPSVQPKMSPRAQYMKMGSDALGTTENESESAIHEIETRRPRYRRKWVRVRKK